MKRDEPTPAALARLRRRYRKGTRVRLLRMEDVSSPKPGATGTVVGVDDIGSIMVMWDSGGSLSVLYRVDACVVIDV